MDINQLIANPEQLNRETAEELARLVKEFPFYQPARLLYAYNLFRLHDPRFGKELQTTSLLIPDRRALFTLIEGEEYDLTGRGTVAVQSDAIEVGDDANRTVALIDNFLSTIPEEKKEGETADSEPHAMPTVTEVTSDYAAFLALQDDAETEEPAAEADAENGGAELKGADLIDNFIRETSGQQRYQIDMSPENADTPSAQLPEEPAEVEIYNYNIVNLCIRQHQYDQALEILRKICLNNPEKSANFASQMQLLEELTKKK